MYFSSLTQRIIRTKYAEHLDCAVGELTPEVTMELKAVVKERVAAEVSPCFIF